MTPDSLVEGVIRETRKEEPMRLSKEVVESPHAILKIANETQLSVISVFRQDALSACTEVLELRKIVGERGISGDQDKEPRMCSHCGR